MTSGSRDRFAAETPGNTAAPQRRRGATRLFLIVSSIAVAACMVQALRSPGAAAEAAVLAEVETSSEADLLAVPGTHIEHYDVRGTTKAAVRADLRARGPMNEAKNRRFDADVHWRVTWRYSCGADGKVVAAEATHTARVRLPRLITPETEARADLMRDWPIFMGRLRRHELGHLQNGLAARKNIHQALLKSRCADANAAGQAVIRQHNELDLKYDAETAHGATQGVRFP